MLNEIDNMNKLEIGDHSVLLYENEKEIIVPVVSFIKESLNRGEKCIYIEGDANTGLIIDNLKLEIDNFEALCRKKQVQFLKKEDTYSLNDRFEADRMINILKRRSKKAIAKGYSGLSITGELSWVLNFKKGKEEIIKYEWKLNDEIFNNYPVVALCRYNLNRFDNEIIRSIIELHKYIIWKEKINENPYYISPEGFKEDNITQYEIQTWLKNISEYKKNESKLERKIIEKENEYEFLFNQIGDAVYLHEINENKEFGKFMKVNDKAIKMLGYSKKQLLDMYPQDIATNDIIERYHQEILENIIQKKNIIYKSKHVTKSKKVIPVEINMNYYTKEGKKYLLSIVRDITEREKDKKKLLETKQNLQLKNEMLETNNEEIRAMNEEIESSYQELDKLTNNLENIIELLTKIDVDLSEEEFLSSVLKKAIELIPAADYGLIYVYKGEKIKIINSIGHKINNLKSIEIKKDYLNIQRDFYIKKMKKHRILNERNTPPIIFNHFNQSLKDKKSSMLINLYMNKQEMGRIILDISSKSDAVFDETAKRLLSSLERLASSYLSLKRYNELQNKFTDEIILSLTNIVEIYDYYTKGHSENVANFALEIATKLGMSKEKKKETYWAGLLHDIGKIIIPQHVLNKKENLTEEEFEIIKRHPQWGYQTLKSSEELSEIAKYILYHHERYDGTGYPEGIKGEEIPKISQILAVADAWDAMRSKRSYRDALEIEDALAELRRNSGTQFSPEIVNIFFETNIAVIREKV